MLRRAAALLVVTACLTGGGLVAAAAPRDTPPPGATAQCVDGTYSYSTHRSGTCSHHGGVAIWLTGSGATTASSTAPAPATTTSSGGGGADASGSVNVGRTVLLKPRTRTSGCQLGPLSDRRCSPGAYYSGMTKAVICSTSFRTSSVRNVPDAEKHQVEVEYGLAPRGYGQTLEIDHIVSLELGGSNDIANLYPEKASFPSGQPGFHVKDKLENRVHDLVCAGQITLRHAQQAIAGNWEQLYKQVYGAAP